MKTVIIRCEDFGSDIPTWWKASWNHIEVKYENGGVPDIIVYEFCNGQSYLYGADKSAVLNYVSNQEHS